jgi:hypothetical protein
MTNGESSGFPDSQGLGVAIGSSVVDSCWGDFVHSPQFLIWLCDVEK